MCAMNYFPYKTMMLTVATVHTNPNCSLHRYKGLDDEYRKVLTNNIMFYKKNSLMYTFYLFYFPTISLTHAISTVMRMYFIQQCSKG